MTEPTIIDERRQEFMGVVYWRHPKERYYRGWPEEAKKDRRPRYLHRVVWEAANGPIPPGKGWHIHHVDSNPDNNCLGNLELRQATEHAAEHMTPERREWARSNIAKAIAKAPEWHRSEAGLEWHRRHGAEGWRGRQPTTLECQQCGKEYQTLRPHGSKFCHLNCKMAALRRRRGHGTHTGRPMSKVPATCSVCGAEYLTRPTSPATTCSDRCRRAARLRESGQPLPATFTTSPSDDPTPSSQAA